MPCIRHSRRHAIAHPYRAATYVVRDTSSPEEVEGIVSLYPSRLNPEEALRFENTLAGYLIIRTLSGHHCDDEVNDKIFIRDSVGGYIQKVPYAHPPNDVYMRWIRHVATEFDHRLLESITHVVDTASILAQRRFIPFGEVLFPMPSFVGFHNWFENAVKEHGLTAPNAIRLFENGEKPGRIIDWIRYWTRGTRSKDFISVLHELKAFYSTCVKDLVIETTDADGWKIV